MDNAYTRGLKEKMDKPRTIWQVAEGIHQQRRTDNHEKMDDLFDIFKEAKEKWEMMPVQRGSLKD